MLSVTSGSSLSDDIKVLIKSNSIVGNSIIFNFYEILRNLNNYSHTENLDNNFKSIKFNTLQKQTENLIKSISGIIELNPNLKISTFQDEYSTLLTEAMRCHLCKERMKLISYLVLSGAPYKYAYPHFYGKYKDKVKAKVINDLKEIEIIKGNISKAFSNGFELIKSKTILPKEVKWRIASDSMQVHFPHLFNLPSDFLIKKIEECTVPRPLWNQMVNWWENFSKEITIHLK